MEEIKKEQVTSEVLSLLENNVGTTISTMYSDFYADKDVTTIVMSARELLSEFLGKYKGDQLIDGIQKKYNLNIS